MAYNVKILFHSQFSLMELHLSRGREIARSGIASRLGMSALQ